VRWSRCTVSSYVPSLPCDELDSPLWHLQARILDTLYSDTRSVSGLNAHLDYPMLMRSFLGQLDQWKADWTVASPSTGHDAEADLIRSEMRSESTFYLPLSTVLTSRSPPSQPSTILSESLQLRLAVPQLTPRPAATVSSSSRLPSNTLSTTLTRPST
jgi:hypothetical protein